MSNKDYVQTLRGTRRINFVLRVLVGLMVPFKYRMAEFGLHEITVKATHRVDITRALMAYAGFKPR